MTNENKDPMPDHDAIARRAHELFVDRGGEHGFQDDDWLRAEAELRSLAEGQSSGEASEALPKNAAA